MLVLTLLLTLVSATAVADDRPRVVAFGDSLTSGRGIGTDLA